MLNKFKKKKGGGDLSCIPSVIKHIRDSDLFKTFECTDFPPIRSRYFPSNTNARMLLMKMEDLNIPSGVK